MKHSDKTTYRVRWGRDRESGRLEGQQREEIQKDQGKQARAGIDSDLQAGMVLGG